MSCCILSTGDARFSQELSQGKRAPTLSHQWVYLHHNLTYIHKPQLVILICIVYEQPQIFLVSVKLRQSQDKLQSLSLWVFIITRGNNIVIITWLFCCCVRLLRKRMPCLQNNWPSRMLVNRSVLIPATFFLVISTAANYMLCLGVWKQYLCWLLWAL